VYGFLKQTLTAGGGFMASRELTLQAWALYQKLIDLERRRDQDRCKRDRRNPTRQAVELTTGYSGRRNMRKKTKLHLLSKRAYKRYKRRLEACLSNSRG